MKIQDHPKEAHLHQYCVKMMDWKIERNGEL